MRFDAPRLRALASAAVAESVKLDLDDIARQNRARASRSLASSSPARREMDDGDERDSGGGGGGDGGGGARSPSLPLRSPQTPTAAAAVATTVATAVATAIAHPFALSTQTTRMDMRAHTRLLTTSRLQRDARKPRAFCAAACGRESAQLPDVENQESIALFEIFNAKERISTGLVL